MRQRFDLAIIGSGPGGYRAAVLGALRGLKVVIVEKAAWGGCCLNRGCVPKKAWYAAARLLAANKRYGKLGVSGALHADLTAAWRHQRAIVEQTRASYVDYLARLGVVSVQGHACLRAPGQLLIDGARSVEAANVIVATGATALAAVPRLAGRVLTTDDLFEQTLPPGRRVAVIGAGAVATELAYILAMLGCEVRWLARRAPLATREFSPTALAALTAALARAGVVPRFIDHVGVKNTAATQVSLQYGDSTIETFDWVLLGTGRVPYTEDLGLERCGIELDSHGFIAVDAHCATPAKGVFAIGDVTTPRMSANLALADAAVAIDNIVSPGSSERRQEAVPEVIYSALELARIGLNEERAEGRGFEPAIGFAAFAANPAALGEDDTEGYVRLVAELDRGALLGAEAVGSGAADIMQVIEQAMHAEQPLRSLARANYNHPARAEEIQNAAQSLAVHWGMSRFVFSRAGGNLGTAG